VCAQHPKLMTSAVSHCSQRSLYISALCGAVAALLTCTEVPSPVDGPAASVVIYGQILDPTGLPAANLNVVVRALRPTECQAQMFQPTQSMTDTTGRYRTVFVEWGTEFTVCIRVHSVPPNGSGLASDTIDVTPVKMLVPQGDSVRIDLQLQSLKAKI